MISGPGSGQALGFLGPGVPRRRTRGGCCRSCRCARRGRPGRRRPASWQAQPGRSRQRLWWRPLSVATLLVPRRARAVPAPGRPRRHDVPRRGFPRPGGRRQACVARSPAAVRPTTAASATATASAARPRVDQFGGHASIAWRSSCRSRSRSNSAQSSYQPGSSSRSRRASGPRSRSPGSGRPATSRVAQPLASPRRPRRRPARSQSSTLSDSTTSMPHPLSRHSAERRFPAARTSSPSGHRTPAARRRSIRRPPRQTKASRRLLPSGTSRRSPSTLT